MTMDETLYKWLDHDGKPYHGGNGTWPLPSDTAPGDWLEIEGELKPCDNGLHLCRARDLLHWIAPTLYACECDGELIECDDKVVVQRARLVSRVEQWDDRTARLLACRCVRETPLHDGRKVWDLLTEDRSKTAVEVAERFANGDTTRDELLAAWAAARDAAMDAAGDAAWAAARDAAMDAAWTAAWAAAGAAARDAAWDAAGAAQTNILCEMLNIPTPSQEDDDD